MHLQRTDRHEEYSLPIVASVRADGAASAVDAVASALEHAVDCVLDDCFFTVGQVVGMRATVDYDAIVLWRERFREKFLAAMRWQGNRWLQDRQNVTSVGWMLAERAVRYAAGSGTIDVDAARQAAADVERYCALHAKRQASAMGLPPSSDGATPLIAGYWCTVLPANQQVPASGPDRAMPSAG
jgi:hypothetical protein